MKYRLLGKSGLRVSELALGTMTFGEEWGTMGANKAESKKIFDAYVNAGGNFIDTANRYTDGTSEKFVGDFISSSRDSFVLATKYTLYNPGRKDDVLSSGNSRKTMVYSLEKSLKRLKTDYIDLYWVHAWDFMTPAEEVMRALDDMVKAGKILYIGISDTPAWIVSQANTLAELKGWTQFVALQIEYSLIQRTPERDLIPMANAFGLAVTPWAALGGGALTGKYLSKKADEPHRVPDGSKRINEESTKITREVVKIAEEMGVTPGQVALNWVRQQSGTFIPIVGARKESQIKDSLECLNFTLPEKVISRLSEVSKIDLGFPHDFLEQQFVRDLVYSGKRDQIIFNS
ncbi:MAG: aldo/keto reductase [Ignavibacteriae bacterium]|nr:aldo/keto reductase [Ignavibacteriota bacterium]